MSLFSKIRGTVETMFQIGLGRSQIKSQSTGELEARNAVDNAYAVFRVATPLGQNDAVNKLYADSLSRPLIVTAQFDGGTALPANTGTLHYSVVTTTGGTASIGDVVYDDGTSTGTASLLVAANGRTIAVTVALVGGTVSFDPDCIYQWDADASSGSIAWVKIGDIGSVTGAIRQIRYAVTNAAAQDSVSLIPANAYVTSSTLEVVTPYSGGATITIGQVGNTVLLQSATDNLATVAGLYRVDQDTSWGGTAKVVRTTVIGAPAAGAGFVLIHYTVPNA